MGAWLPSFLWLCRCSESDCGPRPAEVWASPGSPGVQNPGLGWQLHARCCGRSWRLYTARWCAGRWAACALNLQVANAWWKKYIQKVKSKPIFITGGEKKAVRNVPIYLHEVNICLLKWDIYLGGKQTLSVYPRNEINLLMKPAVGEMRWLWLLICVVPDILPVFNDGKMYVHLPPAWMSCWRH